MKFSKCCNTCSTEHSCKSKCFLCNFELFMSPNLAVKESTDYYMYLQIQELNRRIEELEQKLKESV